MKKLAMWALISAFLGILVFGICSLAVFAASFSWVYNNVEQGNNGQASPKIEINGAATPKVSSDSPGATLTSANSMTSPLTPAIPAGPAASSPPVGVTGTSTQKISDLAVEPRSDEFKHWTLGTGLVLLRAAGSDIGSTLRSSDSTNFGGVVNLGYRFSHDLGASALLGFYQKTTGNLGNVTEAQASTSQFFYGGEVEFTPFHLGFLGNDHFIDLGGVGAVTSLDPVEGSSITVNGGPLAEINFSNQFAVMADYRFAVNYSMAEAKVALRF